MAFKPNYHQQRGDRDRAKAQKKQERLQRRDEAAAKRRAERDDVPAVDGEATPDAENDGNR
jgi:hypothetical protein